LFVNSLLNETLRAPVVATTVITLQTSYDNTSDAFILAVRDVKMVVSPGDDRTAAESIWRVNKYTIFPQPRIRLVVAVNI